jgi:hypothetical protein
MLKHYDIHLNNASVHNFRSSVECLLQQKPEELIIQLMAQIQRQVTSSSLVIWKNVRHVYGDLGGTDFHAQTKFCFPHNRPVHHHLYELYEKTQVGH